MEDTAIVTGVGPEKRTARSVGAEMRELLRDGVPLRPAGAARQRPQQLLPRYMPRYCVRLFDVAYYLTDFRYRTGLNFLVAFVRVGEGALYPRVFYKDSSLLWRVASHVAGSEDDAWIGKGDVAWESEDGGYWRSAEETTNLPFEIQDALDRISRNRPAQRDQDATRLLLRRSPPERLEAYADFTGPRRRARERAPVNGGRPVVRLRRRGEPSSLVFTPGFEPDFSRVLEATRSASRLYGGRVVKYRFLSTNRSIQHQFVATPTHVWMNPPQTLSTEISTYGQRPSEVLADEDACIPGFEYHFIDDSVDPPELQSQIPAGFVGPPSEVDPARADASPWLEKLPVVQQFRRRVWAPRRRKA